MSTVKPVLLYIDQYGERGCCVKVLAQFFLVHNASCG